MDEAETKTEPVTVKPLKRRTEKETPSAAMLRKRMIAMTDRPLISQNVQELSVFATAVVGYLQSMAVGASGLPKSRKIISGITPYVAGIPSAFGVVPVSDMRDMYGSSWDPSYPPTIISTLKALLGKTRIGTAALAWRLTRGRPEDREPEFASEIRAQFRMALEKPLTIRSATAFMRLVDAVVPLIHVGAAQKRRASLGLGSVPYGEVSEPMIWPNPGSSVDMFESLVNDEDESDEDEVDGLPDGAPIPEPYVGSSSRENFGAKAMREILAVLPKILGARTKSPTEIVRAIIEAEQAGMPKLASKLREQLGVRDPDEGEAPLPGYMTTSADLDDDTALVAGVGGFFAAAPGLAPSLMPGLAKAVSEESAAMDEADGERRSDPTATGRHDAAVAEEKAVSERLRKLEREKEDAVCKQDFELAARLVDQTTKLKIERDRLRKETRIPRGTAPCLAVPSGVGDKHPCPADAGAM